MFKPEEFEFTSRVDGVKDSCYVIDAGRNTTCLVYLHGHGSHGDQFFTRKDVAAILVPMVEEYNLSVISPNLRGNAWMSPAAVSDLCQLLTQQREIHGFSRYIFCSGSMGGTGALIFATVHPELVDGLGILGGATDIRRYLDFCRRGALPVHKSIAEAIESHYSPGDYETHNVCLHFEKLTMPLCFLHGAEDQVMPPGELEALRDLMKNVPTAEFRLVPGEHDAPLPYFRKVFEKVSGLRPFDQLYRREHATMPAMSPIGCHRNYNLFCHYQGEYYAAHSDEEPMCILHAHGIQYALEHLPLDFGEDQLFFGGAEQFICQELPEYIPEDEYRKNYKICIDSGMRWFRIGWDHAAPDFETLVEKGLGDFIRRAEMYAAKYRSPESQAMLISLRALSAFFLRAADFWAVRRPVEAERLRRMATCPPETFADALQLVWMVFIVLEAEHRFHNALARMDQYLYGVFKRDAIDHTAALNMLCHLFCKVEGIHEVTNICIGGVRPDGADAANELSFLILQAVERVRSASTNLSARVHHGSTDEFLMSCIRLISTGIGFPAIMNDEVYIPSLCECGIPLEAARDYALFGCVEGNIPGHSPAWSDSFFSLPERFVSVLGKLETFGTYRELRDAFAEAVRIGMKEHLENYDRQLRDCPPDRFPDPMLSALTASCLERGRDINDGGADYPRLHGVGMVGLATIVDSLAAVKKLVFEEGRIGKSELLSALKDNFADSEEIRLTLVNCAPKYGNDDEYVDSIAADVVGICSNSVRGLRICDGGFLKTCMASNISNIPCGKVIPATPDGRFAWAPLSNAASPNAGMERSGPTAFINSIVAPDYHGMNCTVVNMRFLPEMFAEEEGCRRMLAMLRRFIEGKGHEIQFNVTDNATLQDAVVHPERHGDLIVRVSGFSAFFTGLSPEVQQDIIRRSAHGR